MSPEQSQHVGLQSANVEQLAPADFVPRSFSGLDGHAPFVCSACDETFDDDDDEPLGSVGSVLDPLDPLEPLEPPDELLDAPVRSEWSVPPLQAKRRKDVASAEGARKRRNPFMVGGPSQAMCRQETARFLAWRSLSGRTQRQRGASDGANGYPRAVTYRHAPPTAPVVTLGPLPLRAVHFVAPAIFAVFGLAIAGAAVASVVIPAPPQTLRCTRSVDRFTCEQWSRDRLVRAIEGSAPSLTHLGGRSAKDCIALGNELFCGGDPRRAVPRLNALPVGGSATVDITESRSVMGMLIGALFGAALLVMAGAWTRNALGRGAMRRVQVTPETLAMEGGATIPRGPHEEVRIVRVSGGRGAYPVWAIDYFSQASALRLGTWMSFAPYELELLASALREALARSAVSHMRRA